MIEFRGGEISWCIYYPRYRRTWKMEIWSGSRNINNSSGPMDTIFLVHDGSYINNQNDSTAQVFISVCQPSGPTASNLFQIITASVDTFDMGRKASTNRMGNSYKTCARLRLAVPDFYIYYLVAQAHYIKNWSMT